MNENTNQRPLFHFCCYQVEQFQEQPASRKSKHKNGGLMLDLNTQSKIKFEPGLTNSNLPLYRILQELFEGYKDLEQILPILRRKRINPQISENLTERDDLQYFIPQLITYMVLQRNLEHQELNLLLIKACLTDFFFAHSVYFYLQSLATNSQGQPIQKVRDFIQGEFLARMEIYSENRLSGHQIIRSILDTNHRICDYTLCDDTQMMQDKQNQHILDYGTLNYPNPPPELPQAVDKVKIKTYNEQSKGFLETPKFWNDLVEIGEKISIELPSERNNLLSKLLKKTVNINLPATVYIPFFTDKIRYYTVLNVWQGRIFSTKERAPFSIWLQIYRQEEEQEDNLIQQIEDMQEKPKGHQKQKPIIKKIYQRISRPFSVIDGENTLKIKNFVNNKKKKIQENLKKRVRFLSFYQKHENDQDRPPSLSLVYETKSDDMNGRKSSSDIEQKMIENQESIANTLPNIFPQPSQETIDDYKKKSIYRNLKSWKMIHLMVKIGDDLRQQQFAMQLISRFQYIFQKENIPCLLRSYQVVALGPDYGLIEMINDVVTLDGLFRKLSPQKKTLRNFFDQTFRKNKHEAKNNFMRSLAGYSLLTYFLQVKDRHNGNLLLHKDGSLVHIDFGFFLSNTPGKGVELEKKVPFKLLTEYVEVLGSINSQLFFEFRRLFYKGFRAILKNKGLIISLVKMMYKSHEGMMNCFVKGQAAIEELENRMNPEGDLQDFCYQLINNSLDNWRAKWYDKFQYILQKIYY